MALDIIGWFITQNMYDNVAEYRDVQGVANPERTWYPQRMLHNHYGNCGELADFMAATGRAALLPVRQVMSTDDHVWNDVLVGDRWIPWQVDWSDGPTRIDSPAVAQDEEYGGSKTLSGIWNVRGDGYPDEAMVGQYTSTITIELTVRDRAGRPVDGARTLLATESYYDPQSLTVAAWGYTGMDGKAQLEVGHDRSYWFHVKSTAGGGVTFPVGDSPDETKVEQLVNAYDNLPVDAVVTRDVTLDVPAAINVADAGESGKARATIDARALTSWQIGEGFQTDGQFIKRTAHPAMRNYLLDQAGYDALLAALPFEALAAAEDAAELQAEAVSVPAGPLWLVAHNASVTETTLVELDLLVQGR